MLKLDERTTNHRCHSCPGGNPFLSTTHDADRVVKLARSKNQQIAFVPQWIVPAGGKHDKVVGDSLRQKSKLSAGYEKLIHLVFCAVILRSTSPTGQHSRGVLDREEACAEARGVYVAQPNRRPITVPPAPPTRRCQWTGSFTSAEGSRLDALTRKCSWPEHQQGESGTRFLPSLANGKRELPV